MLSAAFRLYQRFFPKAPQDRKNRHSSYKPAPLRSNLQQYKKRERSSQASLSPSSSHYSSSSGSTASSDSGGSFEALAGSGSADSQTDAAFLRMEFARLQVQPLSSDTLMEDVEHSVRPGLARLFEDPCIQRWLEGQRQRDAASKESLPSQAPPLFYTPAHLRCAAIDSTLPLPVPSIRAAPSFAPAPSFGIGRAPHQASSALKKWHCLQKEAESLRADQQVYARVRGTPSARYAEYNEKWAALHAAPVAPTLTFADIPWPVILAPTHASHIMPVEVHQFVLCAKLETITPAGQTRLNEEIKRFHPDKFAVRVLPLVLPRHRAAVAEAAAWVLDILLKARVEIKRA
ncbi:hypothetical protein B0H17DRAFT_1131457 [Mycena rosella]|uniref:Uncharacterized protein n=1 Tax=Mycena rosella TaxID=1033263 RepID=A0AAD7DNJ2_MYCRO|nr:hypothetical protein B0H17DRAFT_1131457 [Mycena rosella]